MASRQDNPTTSMQQVLTLAVKPCGADWLRVSSTLCALRSPCRTSAACSAAIASAISAAVAATAAILGVGDAPVPAVQSRSGAVSADLVWMVPGQTCSRMSDDSSLLLGRACSWVRHGRASFCTNLTVV